MENRSIYIETPMLKRLEKEAKKRRWSFNTLMRYILENWLKRNKSKEAGDRG
jgi:predicted nuclease of restriction endonuclease-like (RecB) superfamily